MSTNKKGVSRENAGPPAGAEEVVHRGIRWRQAGPDRLYWYNEGLARWVLWSMGQDAPPLPPGWAPARQAAGSNAREASEEGGRAAVADRSSVPRGAPGTAPGKGAAGAAAGGASRERARAGETDLRGTPAGSGAAPARNVASDQGADSPTQPKEHGGLLRYMPDNAMARRRSMASPYRWVPVLIVVAIVVLALYQATRSPARATPTEIAAAQALEGKCLAREPGHPDTYSTVPVGCHVSSATVKVVAVVLTGKASSCPRGSLYAQVAKPGVVGEPFECLQPLGQGR